MNKERDFLLKGIEYASVHNIMYSVQTHTHTIGIHLWKEDTQKKFFSTFKMTSTQTISAHSFLFRTICTCIANKKANLKSECKQKIHATCTIVHMCKKGPSKIETNFMNILEEKLDTKTQNIDVEYANCVMCDLLIKICEDIFNFDEILNRILNLEHFIKPEMQKF